jgi:hypothetical protein
MKKLSPIVYYYEPAETPTPATSRSPPTAPQLVVMFSWMGARDVHIAKYITRHQALFPTAKILLVQTPVEHSFPGSAARMQVAPAVDVVRAISDASPTAAASSMSPSPASSTRPQMLVHISSNGGAKTFSIFLELFAQRSGSSSGLATLPTYAMVLDSAPSQFTWMRAQRAFSQALPPWASPLVHIVVLFLWVYYRGLGGWDPLRANMTGLLSSGLLACEVRRTYIYSEDDEMVDWHDVEAHAAEAAKLGCNVRLEKFVGSKHVAHARLDPDRYWNAVKETWEG